MKEALATFKCTKDSDIETFLHTKAIDFIKRDWCSVYLILNEEEFINDNIVIEAYFTLSHKTLSVPETLSKTKVKDINGLKRASALHFVLIGQLGKYISASDKDFVSSSITSKEILDFAFEVIYASSNLIPCRCVLVECSDEEKVRRIYEDYKFKYFQHDGEHHQYYKLLN